LMNVLSLQNLLLCTWLLHSLSCHKVCKKHLVVYMFKVWCMRQSHFVKISK
uniref:Uncharacterized protein n=1 Tax=Zosterops lateralis melanops TaxID=1220523 RepID=A0A8D2P8I2_ZOSLA